MSSVEGDRQWLAGWQQKPVDQLRQVYHGVVPKPVRDKLYFVAEDVKFYAKTGGTVTTEVAGLQARFRIRNGTERNICYYLEGEAEPLAYLLEHVKVGTRFLDVGASTGLYTVFAGLKGALVDAVEPHPETARRLKENVLLNGLDKVMIHQYALGWEGEKPFGSAVIHNDVMRTPSMRVSAAGDTQYIAITSLDWAVENSIILPPDIVKVDVEGADLLVLKSARETLLTYKPLILLEIHNRYLEDFGHSSTDVRLFLQECGYEIKKEWARGGETLVWCEGGK